ncbi:TPA: transglycosylase SLT domain-containing protein [Stenotrophomonas maltophilia]|nr:transglycosylase SLT domain-containing protein [Stenotrophomonas maltophilia]HDS1667644.1 transglycosylase SLT domain-containing protein [Stenotrophomonas maltophilia]
MFELLALAQQCAPDVSPLTMAAIVEVESSRNPFAIGVVGGKLPRQPRSKGEALAAVQQLKANGFNYSVGISQVNRYNLAAYGLTEETAFDACANLRAGSRILQECYGRALAKMPGQEQQALHAAFSCYYSGNFKRGFVPDRPGELSYVAKVVARAGKIASAPPAVPAVGVQPEAAAIALGPIAPMQLLGMPAQQPRPMPPPADHAPVLAIGEQQPRQARQAESQEFGSAEPVRLTGTAPAATPAPVETKPAMVASASLIF